MSVTTKQFKHVSYLWNEKEAAALAGDEVGLLIYRSNLLGADLRLTNYGGGNTSCKAMAKDPLTGKSTEVMWVKGSGGDLGTLKRSGLAALYTDRLLSLKNVYRGLEFEDEMVELFNHCIYDLSSKAPSIDTPLHGFLPFAHIDHLHPDAAIAIAAARDGKKITQELFGGKIGWVEWQRPGFDLGLKLKKCLDENPGIRGIMLGSHGLFTWGDTAYESYINTLEVIETCAQFLENETAKQKNILSAILRSLKSKILVLQDSKHAVTKIFLLCKFHLMKKIILFYLSCLLTVTVLAQKETFDIVTYTPPAGWKKEVKYQMCTI